MRKKIGTILLAAALTVSCFACSKQPEQAAPVGMTDTVNDYESVVEFDTMLIEGQLGKIETNDDATYIKSGKQSAKITVDAQPFISGVPKLYQSFTQEKSGNYYDDFGYTSRLRLQVYNANAGNRTLQMELICTGGGRRSAFFTLREGWNDVVYEIKREYLPMYSDPETLKSSLAVRGVNFGFERPARDEGRQRRLLFRRLYQTAHKKGVCTGFHATGTRRNRFVRSGLADGFGQDDRFLAR